MKTPITWYGGKQRMLKHILPLIPEHTTYTESFFGGGAVFFAKQPALVEIINDTNKEAINFYSVITKYFNGIQAEIQSTLHSRTAFNDAKVINQNPHLFDEIKRAWAFFVLSSQSFSSNFSSFGYDVTTIRTINSVANKRESFTDDYKKRLERTIIENDDALNVIKRYDEADTFHYVDPPYFNSNCHNYKGYTEADFKDLLNVLSGIKGKFLLSSYPSDILTEYTSINSWFTKTVDKQISVTSGLKNNKAKFKTEVLTANYPIIKVA